MTRIVAALFVTVLVAVSPLRAQEDATATLTLAEAVRQSVAQNPDVLASRAGVDAAAAGLSAARAGYWPALSFAEGWQRGNQPVFVFGSLLNARRFGAGNFALDALNHPEAIGVFRSTLQAEQVLFDGGRTQAAAAVARHTRDIAEATRDKALADLIVEVTEGYGRLLIAQTERRAAAAAEQSAAEDLTRGRLRRDAGTLTEGDVLALVVHAAEVADRRITAESRAAVANANLNRLLGAPVDRHYEAVEPQPAALNPDALAPADASLPRPELRLADAAEAVAEARARAARASWRPQLATQASVELTGTRFQERASAWVIGGEVRWNLSTGGAERAQVRAAEAAVRQAKHEQDAVRAAMQVDLLAARQQLIAARARTDVGRATVDAAKESQRVVRERFGAGLASVGDVLRASAAVLDAEVRRVAALVDATVAEAQLTRALARIVP